jgi:Rps23 Pro-64 3,4-dihydroxylase Tpa1-like proline 4-hydroxylase
MQDILIRPDFMAPNQCEALVWPMKLQHEKYINKVAHQRVEIHAWDATYPPALVQLRFFRDEATELVRSAFQNVVYMEYCQLKASFAGDYCVAHCDNCKDDASPGHTPARTHTCNLYLNECGTDYEGGELTFPERGLVIKPTSGMLVAFPSGRAFKHEVLPISSGVRYAVLSWFVFDEQSQMRVL